MRQDIRTLTKKDRSFSAWKSILDSYLRSKVLFSSSKADVNLRWLYEDGATIEEAAIEVLSHMRVPYGPRLYSDDMILSMLA